MLTAVRNGAEFIAETISSIQAQTFKDWEYIIVDDGSDDQTVPLIEAASRSDRRLRLLRRKESGGPFVAANDGLREAQGNFIVRTDADDLSPVDRIERQLAFLASNRQYRACISPWRSFNERGLIPGSVTHIPTRQGVLRWYLLLRSFASHSSLCIERASLSALGGYQELRVGADFRLLCKLNRLHWVGVIPQVLSFVRRHKNRISTNMGALQTETALETMHEHLEEVAGVDWSTEDLRALWLTGHGFPTSLHTSENIVSKWDSLWRADVTLSDGERRELAQLSAYHRWQAFHVHMRQDPYNCGLAIAGWILKSPTCVSPGFRYFASLLPSNRLGIQIGRRQESRWPIEVESRNWKAPL